MTSNGTCNAGNPACINFIKKKGKKKNDKIQCAKIPENVYSWSEHIVLNDRLIVVKIVNKYSRTLMARTPLGL